MSVKIPIWPSIPLCVLEDNLKAGISMDVSIPGIIWGEIRIRDEEIDNQYWMMLNSDVMIFGVEYKFDIKLLNAIYPACCNTLHKMSTMPNI